MKIYFWQIVSIMFNFAAVFVVTPFISSNQSIYGIYAIVTSAYLFISYADFGFLSAGMKYASESYARNDIKEEIQFIGFSGMVFLLFVLLYSCVILLVSISPGILVTSLKQNGEIVIARQLLIILGIFCPVFVLQRILQIIFGIRLEDYKFQRILIVSSVIKVVSAILFFGSGRYLIVEFFLFSQLCTFGAVIVGLFLAKRSLNYDLKLLFKSFKLSKKFFNKTKKLAFTSLFLTFSWILYYELDTFVIAKALGPKSVAIFAIALTIMTYFRSIFGVFFTPFIAKFNHFIGLKDKDGLKAFLIKVLIVFLPITVFPVLSVFMTTENFILTWVGSSYHDSIKLAEIMLLGYIFSFISYPAGILIMALERVKLLYFTSALQPIIYWVGIAFTYSFLGLESFAYFKFTAFFLEAIVYILIILKFLGIKPLTFFRQIVLPALPSIVVIVALVLFLQGILPKSHNKVSLMLYFISIGVLTFVGIVIYYFMSLNYRTVVNDLLIRIKLFAKGFRKIENISL